MTNKLCLAGIAGALLVSMGHYAQAGEYIRTTHPVPVTAVAGPFSASSPNPNAGETKDPQDPHTEYDFSIYGWQWKPDNDDLITDPPPSRYITHSYVLGSGSLTAKVEGHASASATAHFTTNLNGMGKVSLDYSANASTDGDHNQSISFPVTPAPTPQTLFASVANGLITIEGLITVTVNLSASGQTHAITEDTSSSADATASGRIQTSDVTLVP